MSAPLYMIKLVPDMRRLVTWAHGRRLVGRGSDLSYAAHVALTMAFGPHAPTSFRLRERRARLGPADSAVPADLYGYTGTAAPILLEHARKFADPEICVGLGIDSLAAKTMPEAWTRGDRLGFEVRVRPAVRQDRDENRAKIRERDAFQVAWERAGAQGHEGLSKQPCRQAVYHAWLAGQLARLGGARLIEESLRLVAFQRLRVLRRGRADASGCRPLVSTEGPDATLSGVLQVTDGSAFASLLKRGIGRHRAFGFGMLLLRPATQDRSRC